MKKLFIILLLLFSFKVYAYENDIFKIEINDDYKLETHENNTYKWTKDNNYISITIEDNTKRRYDIGNFTEKDILNQKEYIENGINNGISKYKIKATVSDTKKIIQNNIQALEYKVYFPSKKITGYDMYQIGRMYTTNKYILTVIYSSDKEIKTDSDEINILNSLNILDSSISYKKDITNYIIFIIVIGIILGIIGFLIDRRKKRK